MNRIFISTKKMTKQSYRRILSQNGRKMTSFMKKKSSFYYQDTSDEQSKSKPHHLQSKKSSFYVWLSIVSKARMIDWSFMLILDPTTQRPLTQARFQFDADLAGNLDNSHSTSAHIGHSVVSFTSKTQMSLSTSTAESEIKAVNQWK